MVLATGRGLQYSGLRQVVCSRWSTVKWSISLVVLAAGSLESIGLWQVVYSRWSASLVVLAAGGLQAWWSAAGSLSS